MWPWVDNPPIEPLPAFEILSEYTQSVEASRKSETAIQQTASLDLDETQKMAVENSMEELNDEQKRMLEILVQSYNDPHHDLRDSHKFELNQTKGNLIPRESQNKRRSLKYKHNDKYLDAHTRHVKGVKKALKNNES